MQIRELYRPFLVVFYNYFKSGDVILEVAVLYRQQTKTLNMKTKARLTLLLSIAAIMTLFLAGCGDSDETPEIQLGELKAKIDVSSISFLTDLNAIDGRRIKANQSVTFTDKSSGSPDFREWTFERGPSTSVDSLATVAWTDLVGQVKVILTVTRSADGETDADTLDLQVGPVEILNRAVFGLEDQESEFDASSKWFFWTPNDGTVSVSLETADGANATAQSLKLTAASNFGEFQLRPHENGAEFLASLASNTTYVFSFYMKASEALTLSEVSLLNVKNDDPKEGWYTPLWTGDAAIADPKVTTSWTQFSYEFTTADLSTFGDEGYADGKADNAGPFFKHFASISGSELNVWIDEMSLKVKDTE
jgi:hypothetical protein